VVSHAQEHEGDDDDKDDGPEVYQLRGDDGGVAVGEDDEVVTLDVEEAKDEVLPSRGFDDLPVSLGADLVERIWGEDEIEEDVSEERLEGGNGCALVGEEAREGVGPCDAEGEDLADKEDEVEAGGFDVCEELTTSIDKWRDDNLGLLPLIIRVARV